MVFEPTSIEHEKFSLHEIIDSIITKNIQILKTWPRALWGQNDFSLTLVEPSLPSDGGCIENLKFVLSWMLYRKFVTTLPIDTIK